MRKPIYLALVSSLVFQACSKSSDSNSGGNQSLSPIAADYDKAPTARAGTMTQAHALEFKNGQGKEVIDGVMADLDETEASEPSAGTMMKNALLPTARFEEGTSETSDCEGTITAGSEADADADGVFDDMTRSIDCTTSGQFATTIKGTVTWKDKDLDKKPGGFTLTFAPFAMTMKVSSEEGQSYEHSTTMSGTFDTTRDGKTMSAKTDLGSATLVTSAQGNTTMVSGRFLTQSFVATDETPETFFANGTLNVTGYVRYGVDMQRVGFVEDPTGEETGDTAMNVSFVLEVNGKDLVRSSECQTGFKSGEFTFTDVDDSVLKATFADCVVNWTYNDAAI